MPDSSTTSIQPEISDREFAGLIDDFEDKYLAKFDYAERLRLHRRPQEVQHDILRQLNSDILRFQSRADMRDFDPVENSEAPATSRINKIYESDKRLRRLLDAIRRFCTPRSKDFNETAVLIAEYRAMWRLYRRINRSVMRRQFSKPGAFRTFAPPKQVNTMSEIDTIDDKPITAAISYSWEEDAHNDWVLNLADKLRTEGGINILLDRYELKAGGETTHFMERVISNADKVILIMTPKYKEKADGREGGVGYEYSMISQEMYNNQGSGKFIPVVRKGTYKDSSPAFLKSRLSHIMTDDATFEKDFMELLRLIYDKPLIMPPPIGKKPDFPDRVITAAPAGSSAASMSAPTATTVIGARSGPAADPSPASAPLIDDNLNLKRTGMTTMAKWTIDLNLVSLNDQSNSSLYRLIRTNLIRGEGGLHFLPFVLDERQKIGSNPELLYEIPPRPGLVSNYFCHEKLRLNSGRIRYEFSEYSNQSMVLLRVTPPFTTLLYLLHILRRIHESLKRQPQIEMAVDFQSNIRAILHTPWSPFKLPRPYDLQIMEIPGNAASDRFVVSEIAPDIIFEIFQRIYGLFVAEEPRSPLPFVELDRKEFDSTLASLLK